jgi:hypothetical protein
MHFESYQILDILEEWKFWRVSVRRAGEAH